MSIDTAMSAIATLFLLLLWFIWMYWTEKVDKEYWKSEAMRYRGMYDRQVHYNTKSEVERLN